LPSGDLADAKNTMRSYSVAAAVTTAAATTTTTTVGGTVAVTNAPTGTAAATDRVHLGGPAADKNTLLSSSFSGPERVIGHVTAITVPTLHDLFASSNPAPFPPLAEVQQEHLLVATVVPDSV
jgi:hypothetical protein